MKKEALLLMTALITTSVSFLSHAESLKATEEKSVAPRLEQVAMRVTDLDRSIEFYQEAFDLTLVTRWESMTIGVGPRTTTVPSLGAILGDSDGGTIELFGDGVASKQREEQQPIHHFAFAVEDIERSLKLAVKAGARLATPVMPVSTQGMSATIAFVFGPDGERIEIIQYN